ncbi:MAG: hypothetical protein V9E89_09450 [Ilumatobacteraceae bacterium]
MTVTLTAEPVPPQRPPKVRTKGGSTLFDRQIMRVAFAGAVRKLDPRLMVRNPVMLIVEVGSVLTTVLFLRDLSSSVGRRTCSPGW